MPYPNETWIPRTQERVSLIAGCAYRSSPGCAHRPSPGCAYRSSPGYAYAAHRRAPARLRRPAARPEQRTDLLRWTEHEIGMTIRSTWPRSSPLHGQWPVRDGRRLQRRLAGGARRRHLAPTDLDTDQWVDTMLEYGATYGVLVIQHCSGFSMFKTNEAVLNATGFNYTYGVEFAQWGGGERDVMSEFVESCRCEGRPTRRCTTR